MTKKTVLITGSTSGIGLGIATLFAKQGCNVIFNGLEKDAKDIAQRVADDHQIEHLFFATNVMDPEAIRQMILEAERKFGSIDILINNAGIQHVAAIDVFPEEKWEAIIAINLSAAFHTCKAVWSKMKENKFGRIINIASAHGLVASEFKSAYVAAKHGLIGFTKTIALEGAPYGITANTICPGYVLTPIIEQQIANQMKVHDMSKDEIINKVMLEKQAIKEFIPTAAIAQAALYLSSDAAAQITGISLPIDGGWTAQ